MPDDIRYVTTDIYLAAFLCHRGGRLVYLRRYTQKRVEYSFAADAELHALLRLYWSGHLTPVIPRDLFMVLRGLKNASINHYR